MRAFFGDLGLARRAAQEEFRRCSDSGGGALYLSMGAAPLDWLGAAGWEAPARASVGNFLDIAEVPAIVALASPELVVIDPANRQGTVQGYAHARRLGLALYQVDASLRESGGGALLLCESYQSLGDGGGQRVRFLAQLRRFCGDFVEFNAPG